MAVPKPRIQCRIPVIQMNCYHQKNMDDGATLVKILAKKKYAALIMNAKPRQKANRITVLPLRENVFVSL